MVGLDCVVAIRRAPPGLVTAANVRPLYNLYATSTMPPYITAAYLNDIISGSHGGDANCSPCLELAPRRTAGIRGNKPVRR